MKTLLILLFTLISFNGHAYSKRLKTYSCNCVTELQNSLDESAHKFNIEYKLKYNSSVKLDNDAEFLEGSRKDEAIILVHGFIASPFEVRAIAKTLNDIGYSVYMPLLYGFGAYGEVANQGKLEIWKNQIKTAVRSLSNCYKKITLGGMSLGAALVTDYALTTKDPKISSLVLMSPYFDISQSVAKILVGPLSTVKESASLSTLFTLSRSDDLTEIINNRKYYSDIMPFITLQEVFKISDELKGRPKGMLNNIPVFLAYSEFDTTISLETAIDLPKNQFKSVSIYKLSKDLKVPHQIGFESSNPKFDEMTTKIARFIGKSNLLHD